MRTIATLVFLILSFGASAADGGPDRESLIEAWEAHVQMLPGTERMEATGEDTFALKDTDLPYEGELRLLGTLIRPSESPGIETDISHTGMIEFELVDLPTERQSSQVYYYWLSDRQMMYFSETDQEWVNTAAYQASLAEMYDVDYSWGPLSFMLNWGIWIVLIGLLLVAFFSIGRQTRKARSLMDETAAINQKASDNLDRARDMQDEVLAIARESRDLQSENNELLKQVLEALKR